MTADKTPPAGKQPGLEQWMRSRHALLANVLLAVALVFTGLAIWRIILQMQKADNFPLTLWCVALAMSTLFGALYLKLAEPSDEMESRYRLFVLGLGGIVGLITFILGIWLPLGPWSSAFVPPTGGTETVPLLRVLREGWWRITLCALAVIGGLVIMFLSLRLARQVERASPGMRRLLYGYNAVLTGLLLIAILGLVNVLSYVQLFPFTLFDEQLDWTPSQIYTLSPASRELLEKEVPGSIKIYALMPYRSRVSADLQTLYKNCKRYKKDMELTFASPDTSPDEYDKVFAKYGKNLEGSESGLVVVYRSDDGKEDAVGISDRSLSSLQPGGDPGSPPRYTFKGENELMKALRKVVDKTPVRIVFTKGNGELEMGGGGFDVRDRGQNLSTLKQRLEGKRNVEIKEVELGVEGGKLGDADVVVIARPTSALSTKALGAVREYLNPRGTAKKGKMILLLDTEVQNREMLKTGLEDLLRENGVELSNTRLLSNSPRPDIVAAFPPPRSTNPIARAFSTAESAWAFRQPRQVSPSKTPMPTLKVEPILFGAARDGVWEESNLTATPKDLLNTYFRSNAPDVKRPTLYQALPVAVAVSESKPRADLPPVRGHENVTQQVPRMVVFGAADWLTSEAIAREESNAIDLFDSCVTWLRGRADLGPDVAEPKERPEYTLATKGLAQSNKLPRLVWLPLGLMILAVLALGGGIWVVRRR